MAEQKNVAEVAELQNRVIADAIWLEKFVRRNTGTTGYDWDKRHRAQQHIADVKRCLS